MKRTIPHHCNLCGADWTGSVENPVQCPRCKRVDWWKSGGGSSVIEHRFSKPRVTDSSPVHRSSGPVAQMGECQTKDAGDHSARSLEVVGSIPAESTKKSSSVRGVDGHATPCREDSPRTGVASGLQQVSIPSSPKVCPSCESDLVSQKGKWVCLDQACGMYGQEQK